MQTYDVYQGSMVIASNVTSLHAANLAGVDRSDLEWSIDEYGQCNVDDILILPHATAITTDVCNTRAHARSIAAQLRDRGWNACVERSGPKGSPEYRVYVFSGADPDLVAYYQIGDSIEFFKPYWIDRR